jgi:hypothetical protein
VLGDSPLPLYIATKKVNKTRFAPLHEAYPQIAYLSDILDEALPGINPMYLGPIEQVHHYAYSQLTPSVLCANMCGGV